MSTKTRLTLLSVAVVCVGSALLMGAAAPAPGGDDSAKLDEIKALLQESVRLQRMVVHRQVYKDHPLIKTCDFEEKCRDLEWRGARHNVETLSKQFIHPFTEGCGMPDGCQKAEDAYREAVKKKIAERQK